MTIYIFVEIVFMYVDLDVFFSNRCMHWNGWEDAPRYRGFIHSLAGGLARSGSRAKRELARCLR